MTLAILDVGGTFIKYAKYDKELKYLGKMKTPRDSQESFLQTIEKILEEIGEVEGIGMSLPGVIDVDRKYIFAGGSLEYNNHTDIHEWEKYFALPIEVENDARCAALAELKSGHLTGIQQGLVITFGTGVGGGIIVNGDLYKGSHLIGGELSVIFSKDVKIHGTQGLFGAIGSITNLVKKIALKKNLEDLDGKKAFELIEQKDQEACMIFEEYCNEVIKQLHNIQCIIDPECICIGGGISENPIFIQGINETWEKFYQAMPIKFPHAKIVKCKYCNDANLLGAYYHYIDKR